MKTKICLLILATSLCTAWTIQPRKVQWEYKVAVVGGDTTTKELNAAGVDGWELVNAEFNGLATVCFFKRAK